MQMLNINEYLDTVVVLGSQPSSKMELANFKHEGIRRRRSKSAWRWRYIAEQPANALLERLARTGEVVQRIDAAVDFDMESSFKAAALGEAIRQRQIQRWRRSAGEMYEDGGYTCRRQWDVCNFALYWDKPSRLTGLSTCHLDLRLLGLAVTRRYGLADPKILRDIQPFALLTQFLVLREIDYVALGRLIIRRKLCRPMPDKPNPDALGHLAAGLISRGAGYPRPAAQALMDWARCAGLSSRCFLLPTNLATVFTYENVQIPRIKDPEVHRCLNHTA